MPSEKKLRKQQAALRKADEEAERLRAAVIAGEMRKHEKRLVKVSKLTEAQRAAMSKAFNDEFAASASGGFVTTEGLAAKAEELGVIFGENQVADLMAVFDTDKDGKLSEDEFAVWWTCGWSSLHQAFRQKELTREMDRLCAGNTTNLPEWKPTLNYAVDATIGDIPADFVPKASLMVVVSPSEKAQYEAGIAENLKLMIDPEDSDDEDDNPPVADSTKTPVMVQLYAGVKDGANEEDIESCLEVLKAVFEEHSAQQDIPAAAKIRLAKDEKTGKQRFHITLYARTDKISAKKLEDLDGSGPLSSLLMFGSLMEHEASNVDGFDHVYAGIDFGVDPSRVLSLGSNIPLLTLAEQLRVVAEGSVTEHMIQMANFLVCKQFVDRYGGDMSNKRHLRALVQKLLPNGAVRSANVSSSFASPQQVFDAAYAMLQAVPVDLAKDQYPDMTEKQLVALKKECADMTRAVKATLQAKVPTDGTIKAMTASPALRKVVNTPKNVAKVALVSNKGVDVNGALKALVDASISHLSNVPISVYCGGSAKNRYFVADIDSESQNLISGFSATAVVAVIDTATPESTEEGLNNLVWCSRFTENATLYATSTTGAAPVLANASDERYTTITCVSFTDLPAKISEASAAKKAAGGGAGDDDSDDDGSEEGGGGAELVKQILSALGKAMGTLDDIHVSTANADLHLHLDNFKINALLPTTTDELGLVRAQGKIVYQAVAQSAEVSLEQLKFDRIKDIIGRWQEEVSGSDDSDSDSDGSEDGAPKPTKPTWSETYETAKQVAGDMKDSKPMANKKKGPTVKKSGGGKKKVGKPSGPVSRAELASDESVSSDDQSSCASSGGY